MSLYEEVIDIISEGLVTQRADYIHLPAPITFPSRLCGCSDGRRYFIRVPNMGFWDTYECLRGFMGSGNTWGLTPWNNG